MDTSKNWWASQTTWASVLQVGLALAAATGVISSDASAIIQTEAPGLIAAAASLALSAWAIYGRVVATKAIGSAPPAK